MIATEFSQLWRIADSDLIQFMTDNPGAGNVLLRTLATILAQRLRQVDPQFYGLSAYAVVESGRDCRPRPSTEDDTETTASGSIGRCRRKKKCEAPSARPSAPMTHTKCKHGHAAPARPERSVEPL